MGGTRYSTGSRSRGFSGCSWRRRSGKRPRGSSGAGGPTHTDRRTKLSGEILNPPPWNPEALIWIALGAVEFPVAAVIARGDFSAKTLILTLIAIPIGAICGFLILGYCENSTRRS